MIKSKIQLKHPAGKKAIRMEKSKYDLLKNVLLNHLNITGASTHTELLKSIVADFKKNNIKFDGSIEWHLEWVKLDLEARNEIKRMGDTSPIKFAVVK